MYVCMYTHRGTGIESGCYNIRSNLAAGTQHGTIAERRGSVPEVLDLHWNSFHGLGACQSKRLKTLTLRTSRELSKRHSTFSVGWVVPRI